MSESLATVSVEIQSLLVQLRTEMQLLQEKMDEVNKILAEVTIKQMQLTQGIEQIKAQMENFKKSRPKWKILKRK